MTPSEALTLTPYHIFPFLLWFGGSRKPDSGSIYIISFGAIKKLSIWLSLFPIELVFEISANFHGIVKSIIEFEFKINRGKHSAVIQNINARSFIALSLHNVHVDDLFNCVIRLALFPWTFSIKYLALNYRI